MAFYHVLVLVIFQVTIASPLLNSTEIDDFLFTDNTTTSDISVTEIANLTTDNLFYNETTSTEDIEEVNNETLTNVTETDSTSELETGSEPYNVPTIANTTVQEDLEETTIQAKKSHGVSISPLLILNILTVVCISWSASSMNFL
ncbi:uncharacterized protein [Parasteatoda tepidariorum]|uniref:uncharacterized protein n=1 Tax=Parasteatoda tepidariorum TaxID=114398 RepID=UPI001C71E5F3|nr:uncharacterized protein LOC107453439 [Parasteatoda tepidariorum]XP_015925756.2 uncharacterized protein LOC107453439 [Parasteatoda tepidariorum]